MGLIFISSVLYLVSFHRIGEQAKMLILLTITVLQKRVYNTGNQRL